jgi:competence protein ComEC
MARWTLGFLLGVMITARCAYLPSLQIACWSMLVCILIIFSPLYSFSSYVVFFIACLCGFSWSLFTAHHRMQHFLPPSLEGKILVAKGTIASIPERHGQHLRFIFCIKEIKTQPTVHCPIYALITIYSNNKSRSLLRLKKGDYWQFAIRLKRPRGFWNPGSFDYQAELFQQNIQARGYILNPLAAHLIQASGFCYFMDDLRENLTLKIKKTLKNSPWTGLIAALTTGLRYDISEEQWQVMRSTGTNHLFAISGLHLAFISGMIYALTRFICGRMPYVILAIPAQQIAALLTGVFAVFYAALAGFAIPIQRALIMLLMVLYARLQRRNISSVYVFYAALFIILLYSPFSVLSASFWLSFMAVALILYANAGRLRVGKNRWAWARTQYTVGLGLIPFSLLFFHQIAWASFAANLIAIPFTGFLILPITFLASCLLLFIPSVGSVLLTLAEKLLEYLWMFLSYLATLSWAQYHTFIVKPWIFLVSTVACFILLAPRGVPGRYLGFLYLLPLFFWKPAGPKSGEIWFTLLDVGQGLASVLQTQHHILVYDTGPGRPYDAGRAVLIPFLQQLRMQKLDMLIVSHGDDDHRGGVKTLVQHLPVTQIISSIPKKILPNIADFCHEGMKWQWDQISFEILYPASNEVYLGNDSSCVLKVSSGDFSILLTGDIERVAENYLIKHKNASLPSTILVVPHHGSKTSSSIEFLNKVQPSIALFPTGYHNQFRFPHAIVMDRYQRLNAIIYDTARDGAITLQLNPMSNTLKVETYHKTRLHFWQN